MQILKRTLLAPSIGCLLRTHFRFSADNIDFTALTTSFGTEKDMTVFDKFIKASNNTLDNINYVKLYKFLVETNCEPKHFEYLFHEVNVTIDKKSDNIRMLLANLKVHVAKQHERQGNYYDALNSLE